MAIREGRLDKHAVPDAAITGSGLLICRGVRVDNDNRPRDRQHSLNPAAQQVCIRLACAEASCRTASILAIAIASVVITHRIRHARRRSS